MNRRNISSHFLVVFQLSRVFLKEARISMSSLLIYWHTSQIMFDLKNVRNNFLTVVVAVIFRLSIVAFPIK